MKIENLRKRCERAGLGMLDGKKIDLVVDLYYHVRVHTGKHVAITTLTRMLRGEGSRGPYISTYEAVEETLAAIEKERARKK